MRIKVFVEYIARIYCLLSEIDIILYNYFRLLMNPELKPVFKFANGLNTPDEIEHSSRARAHGEKIFESVALVVEYIEDQEYCETLLKKLGNLF